MMISSDIVGLPLREYRTEITWRQTTNYAAGIGDMNSLFTDDCREEGITAHPIFVVALSWPIIQNLYDYIKLPFELSILQTMVHYTQSLEFNRPVRPGDKLTIQGTVAAVFPERAGTHIVFRFVATDQKGQPVYTEHTGAMVRGVGCEGTGQTIAGVPGMGREAAGTDLWIAEIPISREAPYIYDGCSDIVFGIHTSPHFAKSVGLPGIILQGTATLAMAVSQVVNREIDGDAARVRLVQARFTGMVAPNSVIKVCLTKRPGSDKQGGFAFHVLNQAGQKAISDGYLTIDK